LGFVKLSICLNLNNWRRKTTRLNMIWYQALPFIRLFFQKITWTFLVPGRNI